MRYAIVSDLHANMQAWKAVCDDIKSNQVDRIICLGDIVGYGPNPTQMLREIRNKVDAVILGNHDAALCGKLDATLFNEDAQKLLEWTRKQISAEDIKFISSFPLTLLGDGFLCAHSEFSEPGNFDYAGEPEEVLPSWKATDSNLLFAGHTHVPALFVLDNNGVSRPSPPQDFTVEEGKRYFINVGSVGQSRDNDLRACYCIYDTATKGVNWRRVAFDVEAYRKAMRDTGLKLDPSYYLPEPKGQPAPSLDWQRTFSPPQTPEKAAHDVVPVQDLKTIPRRHNKIPLSVITLGLLILMIVGTWIWRKIPHELEIQAASPTPVAASPRNNLSMPDKAIKPGQPIPGWDIHLEDARHQQVGINLDPFKQPFLYFSSKKPTRGIGLSSSWVTVQPGENWLFDASLQQKKGFTGSVSLSIMLMKGGGTIVSNFVALPIPPPQATGLSKIQEPFIIPADATMIRFNLQGYFAGTVLILQPKLTPLSPSAVQALKTPKTAPGAIDPWTQRVK